jgi:hypothetical protein
MKNMKSFVDELEKIALPVSPKLLRMLKWPGILGAGYLGGKSIEQAGKDYMLGRRIRKQYAQQ